MRKTAFVTPFGVYCYIKMPFVLKNAGSTYKKCVHIVLEGQIGRNVKHTLMTLLLKANSKATLIVDLEETFNNLHKNKMMLNPDKCSFGVSLGKLLGFLVSYPGQRRSSRFIPKSDERVISMVLVVER